MELYHHGRAYVKNKQIRTSYLRERSGRKDGRWAG